MSKLHRKNRRKQKAIDRKKQAIATAVDMMSTNNITNNPLGKGTYSADAMPSIAGMKGVSNKRAMKDILRKQKAIIRKQNKIKSPKMSAGVSGGVSGLSLGKIAALGGLAYLFFGNKKKKSKKVE